MTGTVSKRSDGISRRLAVIIQIFERNSVYTFYNTHIYEASNMQMFINNLIITCYSSVLILNTKILQNNVVCAL